MTSDWMNRYEPARYPTTRVNCPHCEHWAVFADGTDQWACNCGLWRLVGQTWEYSPRFIEHYLSTPKIDFVQRRQPLLKSHAVSEAVREDLLRMIATINRQSWPARPTSRRRKIANRVRRAAWRFGNWLARKIDQKGK
jgi:hypothetical protein